MYDVKASSEGKYMRAAPHGPPASLNQSPRPLQATPHLRGLIYITNIVVDPVYLLLKQPVLPIYTTC